MMSVLSAPAEWIPLWPGEAPGGAKPILIHESESENGHFSNTGVPQYEVYLPAASQRTGAAVVVFPGGGYMVLANGHEGRDYAKWLNERGIVAVLVKYRVSDQSQAGFQYPVPLLDARRAIRTTRSRAKEWGVDPAKVGVMGSSAGGHLAAMSATLWSQKFPQYEGVDAVDGLECRPDFTVLVYPVIQMAGKGGHAGSKSQLLGKAPDAALAELTSAEKQVTPQTPPVFLVHAADDDVVPVRNSLEFAARCAENRVPVVCHVFSQGAHGFGLKGKGDSVNWPELLEDWLVDRALVKRRR